MKEKIKNKKLLFIPLVIVLLIGAFFLLRFLGSIVNTIRYSDKVIYIKEDESKGHANNSVYSDYESYKREFNNNDLKKSDFDNYYYVLKVIEHDECSDPNFEIGDYKIYDNYIDIILLYNGSCGMCSPTYYYYLIKVDKNIVDPIINIEYKQKNYPRCDPNVVYKPLIYLYPEEEINVTVKLGYPELLKATYPKYTNKWEVLAKPNGDLIDKSGRTYYGLYWEGLNYKGIELNDGFVVSREETISFLEEKLKVLGLNEREANEFIIYWLPILEENEYNLIRFESIDIINSFMPLNIEPEPDTIIRVLMEYKPLRERIEIKEQELITPERKGFSVVEWGGTLVK